MPRVLDPDMANGEQQAKQRETKMVRAGLFLLSGNAAASLLLLVRNLWVAALIPVGDYGVAASFAIVMAMVEMTASLGLQQQIVQARHADAGLQAGLQGFHLGRGVLAGVILFMLAGPLAAFLGVPEVAWAYRVLAIVPVVNALQHFDMHRMTRDMTFGPVIWGQVLPALGSLLVIWPLAVWFGDARVMLWAIVVQAVLMMGVSHVLAQRRYRVIWDAGIIRQSLSFGWPLLVNALLLFAVFQGDKIIVGRVMGMEALAVFAMGMTLTLTPTLVMAKSAQSYLLPQLSQATGARFAQLKSRAIWASLGMGFVLVGLVWAFGPWFVDLVLGAKYAGLGALLIVLALMQALRVAKAGPAIVALAVGRTQLVMWPNLVRVAALPIVYWLAATGAPLISLAWVGIVAEGLGYLVALWGIRKENGS